jgi:hypothetical protein
VDASVSTVTVERLRAPLALLGSRSGGVLDSQFGHDNAGIGRKLRFLEPRIKRLDISSTLAVD